MSEDARVHWHKLADKLLLNRKIVRIEWMDEKESDERFGWYKRPLKIHLDDGNHIIPQCDDEGNDGGALLWVNPNETTTNKNFPGQKFIKTEVLPVF